MARPAQAALWGLGSYAPERRLTNNDFAKTLETSDEWITSRTGIKARHIAEPDQATSDLCLPAAQAALKDAGVEAHSLDMIIVATLSPDHFMPTTACKLQHKLGLGGSGIPAFDLNAACSGFVYALSTAKAFVESGQANRVLVVGAEIVSKVLDYKDRSTCILFGDAAGAAVIGPHRTDGPSHPIRETRIWADGEGGDLLGIPAGGTAFPTTHATVDENKHCVFVKGREVFRFAVSKMVEMIQDQMKRHDLKAEDIGCIVPHQANFRILEAACERLDVPMELFFTNLAEYGNTSAASVPLALDEAHRTGKLPAGKPVLMAAFGGGLTWASAIIDW